MLSFYSQHYMMISPNLLDTGLTKAIKLALVVGSEKARSDRRQAAKVLYKIKRLEV